VTPTLSAKRAATSLALALVPVAALAQAPVTPSGATATTVTSAANGAVSVGVAAPNVSGVSLNRYTSFSVPVAGVALDNRRYGASTIVNEVTAPNRSYLYGTLSVMGPAAHVVLANPYGITVDGGRFVNVGGVALATGQVSLAPSATMPGLQNVVVTSGSGDILVTGAGLSGSIANLQLLAGRIKVDGPIANAHPGQDALVGVSAGDYEATLDSSVFPGAAAASWAILRDRGGAAATKDILIDVTPNGSISASRVHMAVGPKGAGVSFAGKGLASIGEFTISATGKVSVPGGAEIRAEKAVKIRAASIDVLAAPVKQAKIASVSGGVTLLAEDGDIFISGLVQGARRDAADPDSKGGVTLQASGAMRLLSETADKLAIVFSSDDDLAVKAGGDVVNDTGRLLSNARSFVEAGGAISNHIDIVGAVGDGAPVMTLSRGRHLWGIGWLPRTRRTHVTWTAGEARLPGQLPYIVGASVFLKAGGDVENLGEIDAMDGALSITARRIRTIGSFTGSAAFDRRCGFTCSGGGASSVTVGGGVVNAAGSAQLVASDQILNDGGLVAAYGNLALSAPSIIGTARFAPGVVRRPTGLYNFFSGKDAFLALQPNGGQFLAPLGVVEVFGARPVLEGGLIAGGAGTITPLGVDQTWPVLARSGIMAHDIGVFRGLW
jgi:filamentous hemagglutinin family protein